MTYIYPQNLKAEANLWLWNLRDFAVLSIALLLSAVAMARLGMLLPMAISFCFAFLTIRLDDTTVIEYMDYAAKFLFSTQQYYEWR